MTIIFAILISITYGQNKSVTDFKSKANAFLDSYLLNYSISSENIDNTGYQKTLDKKTVFAWTKKQTIKSKKSYIINTNQKVYQRLYIAFYEYKNELNGKAAFDTLTNCFGMLCERIIIDKEIANFKTFPSIYIINKTNIVSCHLTCEQEFDNWTKIKEDLINSFADETSKIITTGCSGPLEWRKK